MITKIDPSDIRNLNRIELAEAIEAIEVTMFVLSEELDEIDKEMGDITDKTHEMWVEMHERRFEVTEEIIRIVRSIRLLREELDGKPPVVELYYAQ